MNRNVCYTVIVGGYDRLPHIKQVYPGWDFICLTPDNLEAEPPWQIRKMEWPTGWKPKLLACAGMIRPHRWLADYDYSLYCDANQTLFNSPTQLCNLLEWPSFGIPFHPVRNCVYEELDKCVEYHKCTREQAEKQKARYLSLGLPHHSGLWETKAILRKHNLPNVVVFECAWGAELRIAEVLRDQPSLGYASWSTGMQPWGWYEEIRTQFFQERIPHGR